MMSNSNIEKIMILAMLNAFSSTSSNKLFSNSSWSNTSLESDFIAFVAFFGFFVVVDNELKTSAIKCFKMLSF